MNLKNDNSSLDFSAIGGNRSFGSVTQENAGANGKEVSKKFGTKKSLFGSNAV